jgi:putative FmdB family regulatory protein
MPIYEYQCGSCSETIEAMQKFSDQPLSQCPKCGGKLSKLISMNSFQLKGGGWYATDYAKTASPKADCSEVGKKCEAAQGSKPGEAKACPSCPAASPSPTEKKA